MGDAAELRRRLDAQLELDRLVWGTSYEKRLPDGSRERIDPRAVCCFGKDLLDLMPHPSLEPPKPERGWTRPFCLSLASLPLAMWGQP